jgi:hypothetical protein
MHRTQLLLPRQLHRRAAEAARARGMSLGGFVREAVAEHIARGGPETRDDAVERVLLAEPYEDPDADADLSADVDHYLYGSARRSKRSR